METIKKYFKIDKQNIAYLKFIFEAYEGIGVITTTGLDKNEILITIARGCEKEVNMILKDISKHRSIVHLEK